MGVNTYSMHLFINSFNVTDKLFAMNLSALKVYMKDGQHTSNYGVPERLQKIA
jgi:hypothetical protein